MLLKDRIAVVTGASRGIGAAIARLFATEGASVVVHYHSDPRAADEVATSIGESAITLRADLRDPAEAAALIEETERLYGRVDILVNNAASFAHDHSAETAEWEDYQQEFAGVVGVTVNTTKAVIPGMKRQRYGRIINTVATLVQRPAAEYIVHTTAKSALIGYSRTLARDLGQHGITVNMVSPGMTLTEYSTGLPEDVKTKVAQLTPLRRLADPGDVARVVLFYASPLADFVTSANIAPDGGLAVL